MTSNCQSHFLCCFPPGTASVYIHWSLTLGFSQQLPNPSSSSNLRPIEHTGRADHSWHVSNGGRNPTEGRHGGGGCDRRRRTSRPRRRPGAPQEGRSVRGAGVVAGAPDVRVRLLYVDQRLPRAGRPRGRRQGEGTASAAAGGAGRVFVDRESSARNGPPGQRKTGTSRSPVRASERAAPGPGGRAASGHHPLLLQDRLHRPRRARRRQDPPSRRRHNPQSQGTDRVRRDQLRGGQMAGPRQAVRLRAPGHQRPRALPRRRPRLRAQDPAARRRGLRRRRRAHQRHRRLLVLHLVSFHFPRRQGRHRRPEPGGDETVRAHHDEGRQGEPPGAGSRREERSIQVLEAVERSEMSDVLAAPLRYRSPLSLLYASISKGNVCVAGDALHPTTPDLAQGACTALEDGVVLARCLGDALMAADGVGEERERVEAALRRFAGIRRWRSAQVIAASYVVGFFQESDHAVVSFVRDKLLSGVLARTLLMMPDHDCGKL